MKKILSASIGILILVSCSPTTKIVKFSKIPNDVFINKNLGIFFHNNERPNIVLRVPNNNDKVTSNTKSDKDQNLLYNAIEKELLKNNYSVRDRGLFNELLNKFQSSDYSKIKELTNTDIILEVVNINPAVVYTTNKIITVKKKKKSTNVSNINYEQYGASAEFRIVLVKNNEIAGSFKYNYQPCPEGCAISTFSILRMKNRKQIELREVVSVNTLEEFITHCTKDLIKSFRS